jgi:hypothetical protein
LSKIAIFNFWFIINRKNSTQSEQKKTILNWNNINKVNFTIFSSIKLLFLFDLKKEIMKIKNCWKLRNNIEVFKRYVNIQRILEDISF